VTFLQIVIVVVMFLRKWVLKETLDVHLIDSTGSLFCRMKRFTFSKTYCNLYGVSQCQASNQ